jgi:drug/metabolite transporter (DMT)-like permease
MYAADMSGTWPGIALAVAASVALNGSFVLQHAGSATAPAITARRPVATLRSLLRSRWWAIGAVFGIAGWTMHVGALARAPVSLVQAFVAGGVVLTIPMAVLGLHHRVVRREATAALLMVGALVLLALGQRDTGRHAAFSGAGLAATLVVLGLAAGLAVRVPGARRAAGLGVAGGLLYGAADLSTKALTGVASRHGIGAVVASPWLLAAIVATMGAFFAFQRGLQLGRPVTVIALMTAATNVATIGGGFAVFGDSLGRTPALAVSHAAGFAIVVIAGWALAPAQASMTVAKT